MRLRDPVLKHFQVSSTALERLAWVVGVLLLAAAWILALGAPSLASGRFDAQSFDSTGPAPGAGAMEGRDSANEALLAENREAIVVADPTVGEQPLPLPAELDAPDTSSWSQGRIEAFTEAITGRVLPEPLAMLRIPDVGIEGAVFDGTDPWSLNLGIGRIEGTATIGDEGNLGLAAHRDGYFRGLENIQVGDPIELHTRTGKRTYRVTELLVVDPEDVHVLDPTDEATVTLVTCYPFRFLGNAPQRFIVKAVQDGGVRMLAQL